MLLLNLKLPFFFLDYMLYWGVSIRRNNSGKTLYYQAALAKN